jgi:hypothetical protein
MVEHAPGGPVGSGAVRRSAVGSGPVGRSETDPMDRRAFLRGLLRSAVGGILALAVVVPLRRAGSRCRAAAPAACGVCPLRRGCGLAAGAGEER